MLKAADFGASVFLPPGGRCTELAGTPAFMAPEVCGCVWVWGCWMARLLSWCPRCVCVCVCVWWGGKLNCTPAFMVLEVAGGLDLDLWFRPRPLV